MTTPKEPREFWVGNGFAYNDFWDNDSDPLTHVIEKHAYDALKAKLASAERVLKVVAECGNCGGCKDSARDYLKNEGGG